MPAKLSAISYVHECTERLTQEFTVKEITAVSRLDPNDNTKVVYLRIKAFIPSDRSIETEIEDFDTGNVIYLKGKFIACSGYYTVCISNQSLFFPSVSFFTHFFYSSTNN